MNRALVTGATGFVGRALVTRLAANGWVVHALTGTRASPIALQAALGRGAVHSYLGARAELDAALAAARPDVVFHLASRVIVDHRAEDIGPLVAANVLLGADLADAMIHAGAYRLVVAASHWQHFHGAEYEPVNLYAATKQALQTILRFYTCATPLRLRIVTLFETYGPSDPRPKLLSLLRRAALSGEPVALTPGEQLVDFLHVDDAADALVAASTSFDADNANELEFAASSAEPMSLRALVRVVEEALGRPVPVVWGGRQYRSREVMRPWVGRLPPGWTPRISLADGLRQCFADDSR